MALACGPLFTAACGEGPAPAAPTPVPSAITIVAPTALLKTGESSAFSVLATLADGSRSSAAVSWLTDNPTVATVDRNGLVRGVTPGLARIIAVVQGVTATQSIRVIPDLAGRWTGPARIVSCVQPDFRACSRSFPLGTTGTFALVLTQNGLLVNGTADLQYHVVTSDTNFVSTRAWTVTGTILENGVLPLEGVLRAPQPPGGLWNWSSVLDVPADAMRGSFQELGFGEFGGVIRLGWDFGPLARSRLP